MNSTPAPAALLFVAFALGGCKPPSGTPPAGTSAQGAPELVKHDFGILPHGETRVAELTIPVPEPGWIPLAFRAGCSCATSSFAVVDPKGVRRDVEGPPVAAHAVQKDEKLVLKLAIETLRKEAVDLEPVSVRGTVVLGEARAEDRRREVPVEFRYGIATPIRVHPKPHVDVGELPRSRRFTQTLGLEARDPKTKVRFANVRTSRPELTATLREAEGKTLLDVVFEPKRDGKDALGAFADAVLVATDLPSGYEVPIKVSGAVIADIRVTPFDAIAFGQIDFATATEQFVNLHDYDQSRDPGFVVTSVVDQNGVDASAHFTARVEPIAGDERGSRLVLRYAGGLTGRVFHGAVTVVKKNKDGPVTKIPFHGFHKSS